jgi:hypothetical protein
VGVGVVVGVVRASDVGVDVAVAGAGVWVPVGKLGDDVLAGIGVNVVVGVNVARGMVVCVGIALVSLPSSCSKFVRRQACRKAIRPAKPAPLRKYLLFIN